MVYEQIKLAFDYDAMEPYIDEETMHVHYDKHHVAYTAKFNAAIEKHPELFKKTAEEILSDVALIPEDIRGAVVNNGGGYVNHNLYFSILGKDFQLSETFKEVLEKNFTSIDKFKEEFENAALTQFGSGWAWLVKTADGNLAIRKTSNQNTPLSNGEKPILCLDVWEHAYYLKYQNKRPDHVKQFWNVINWEKVESLYKED